MSTLRVPLSIFAGDAKVRAIRFLCTSENWRRFEVTSTYVTNSGTYGVVYRCRNKKTGQLKALKRIKLIKSSEGLPSVAIREVSFLKELQHPNIVTLEDALFDHGQLYLVFEFLSVDLQCYLKRNCKTGGLPPETVKLFMYQMLQALLYCHSRRILHRDLKPQNVLVDVDRNVVKLADFGLAKSFDYPLRRLTETVLTLWYRSPELLLGETLYCDGVDMWSMGCIFWEMAMGYPLFCGDSEVDQLFKIFRIMGTPTEESWPNVSKLPNYNLTSFPAWSSNRLCSHKRVIQALDANGRDLLMALLLYNPLSRIDARHALLHPYFGSLDMEKLPAVGEEFVGLPVDKIPPTFAEVFDAAISLAGSELEVEGEEENAEDTASDKMPKLTPSTVLLGATVYQISAARGKSRSGKGEKGQSVDQQGEPSEFEEETAQPLAESHKANMSID